MTRANDVLAPEPGYPTCPTCGSQGRRCIETDGELAYPWHAGRDVRHNLDFLADLEWVKAASPYAVGEARGVVAAYLAGLRDGATGTPAIDTAAAQAIVDDLGPLLYNRFQARTA